jgi:hypothetical protein
MQTDDQVLDLAIERASQAAKKVSNYKSETYFAALLAFLLKESHGSTLAISTSLQSPNSPALTSESKPYSPAELFGSKSWSTELDKVMLAGYFLEQYSRTANYTIDEIRSCLISAKISLPKNINLATLQSVQRGWMMEIPSGKDQKKAWSLTQSGEHRVEEMNKSSLQDSQRR